jgi:hypothetical protein
MTKAPSLEIVPDGDELYVVFNGVKIAKRGAPGTPQASTWISLEPGYRVLDQNEPRAFIVEYNGVRVHQRRPTARG